ncbi:hypothetical protein MD484_g4749, partial [Candolleomyces efflorescens]
MAQTLARRYSEERTFGGSFFFDKASPQRNNPSCLVATLAAQLASSIPGLMGYIISVLESEGPGILNKTQEQLLDKIIVEPFRSLKAQVAQEETANLVAGIEDTAKGVEPVAGGGSDHNVDGEGAAAARATGNVAGKAREAAWELKTDLVAGEACTEEASASGTGDTSGPGEAEEIMTTGVAEVAAEGHSDSGERDEFSGGEGGPEVSPDALVKKTGLPSTEELNRQRWIIIDGLDACVAPSRDRQSPTQADPKNTQLRVLKLISTLRSRGLPFLFLVFTRPETWIMDYCKRRSKVIELVDICALDSHERDVETVLRVGLRRIAAGKPGFHSSDQEIDEDEGKESDDDDVDSTDSTDEDWPGEDRIKRLIDMTRGNMLAASNVIQRIEKSDSDLEGRLNDLLKNGLRTKQPGVDTTASVGATPNQPEGQFSGATFNGSVQFGGSNTNHTFHQHFQFPTTFDFSEFMKINAAVGPAGLSRSALQSQSDTVHQLLQTHPMAAIPSMQQSRGAGSFTVSSDQFLEVNAFHPTPSAPVTRKRGLPEDEQADDGGPAKQAKIK